MKPLRYIAWAALVAMLALLIIPTTLFRLIGEIGLTLADGLADIAEDVKP